MEIPEHPVDMKLNILRRDDMAKRKKLLGLYPGLSSKLHSLEY
jgi:hypothetical protein